MAKRDHQKKSYRGLGLKPGQTKTLKMIRGRLKGRRMKMKIAPSGKPYPVNRPK